ncbi:hypothetical protein AX17_000945 [Amanita inopinata Kibby_2008]|nr:hypothetical protein AX17_000945 [Amanita inopinata Kibby_2008]
MATSLQSTKPPSGSDQSTPSSTRWGGMGEPGGVFKSGHGKPSRGKGGGRGRGPREGRGKDSPRRKTNDISTIREKLVNNGNSHSTTSPAAVTGEKEKTPAPSSRTSHPRPQSQASSRSIPSIVVSTSSNESSNVHNATKSYKSRRRSNTSRSTASQMSMGNAEDKSRFGKSRLANSSQPQSGKDTPPHLMNSSSKKNLNTSGMRLDIDALVERVRTHAMANNRPSTPGSHIDWAGDDDDTLPDLDDWVVQTSATSQQAHDMISPIMVDGLTPLPDLITSASLLQSQDEDPIKQPEEEKRATNELQLTAELTRGMEDLKVDNLPNASKTPQSVATTEENRDDTTTRPQLISTKPESSSRTPHPSLPPRPPYSDRKKGKRGLGPRMDASRRQARPSRIVAEDTTADKSLQLSGPSEKDREDKGLVASIHAPKEGEDEKYKEGLEASAHAPQGSPVPVPNTLPHSSVNAPRGRHVAHSRAHTTGRPTFPRFAERLIHSGTATPRAKSSLANHARTQSSPPVSHSSNRPLHSRPVLTVDALSRIAKSIGGTTPSNSRSPPITTFTE